MADPTTSDRDQPLVVVSSDTHIGPRLREDLRPYCPAQHLDAFDAAVTGNAGALIALGKAFADETDPDTDRGVVFRRNWQTEGHHDITARLRDMDYDGIAAEVIFHGSQNSEIIPFQAARAFFGELPDDLELAALGLHIYNAWLADYCSHEPARHVGLVHLPWWDLDAAIAELQWAREAGLRSVNFPAPRAYLPPYNSREWEPFWSACADLDMPLTTHAGAGDPSSWSGPETVCLLSLESGGWPARLAMHFMILGGVFERHPNLRLVLTEQPGDWWTSTVDDLDSTYLATIHTPGLAEQTPRRRVSTPARTCSSARASSRGTKPSTRCATATPVRSCGAPTTRTWKAPSSTRGRSTSRRSGGWRCATRSPGSPTTPSVTWRARTRYGCTASTATSWRRSRARIGAPTLTELGTPLDAIPEAGSAEAFRTVGAWS